MLFEKSFKTYKRLYKRNKKKWHGNLPGLTEFDENSVKKKLK